MRCPECEQRNSVAASKCKFCGVKIRKKTATKPKLVALGALAVLVTGGAASFVLPKLTDQSGQLGNCAKRLAAGPKSAEDAKSIKNDFDKSLQAVLQRFGDENSGKLASRLQTILPSSAFEVHVVDLPRGLKLVEVDTLLQASDFLVMKGTTETKIFPLPEFEVFDDAKAVNDQAGPVLVLLGHTSGQMPHRPLVRTYALLPDYIVDETEKMVPPLKGEGTAKFAHNSADVFVEMSVGSMAKEEKVNFSSPLPAELAIRQKLRWAEARFTPDYDLGVDANSYLFMVGRCLASPELLAFSSTSIGEAASRMIKERAGEGLGEVSITAFSSKKMPGFALRGKNKEFLISIARTGSKWELGKFAVSETGPNTIAASPAGSDNAVQSADNAGSAVAATVAMVPPAAPSAVTAGIVPVTAPESVSVAGAPAVAPAVITVKSSPGFAPSTQPAPVSPMSALQEQSKKLNSARDRDAGNSQAAAQPVSRETTREEKQPRAKEGNRAKEELAKVDQEKSREKNHSAGGHQAVVTEYLSSPSIRLRSRPALHGSTVTDIPRGAKIAVLNKENGWYKIAYNGQTGYVYGGLVEFKKPSSSPAPSPAYTTAVVTRSWTVRDEHRRALAHPQRGDRLVIVSGINKNNKYKVQLSDGRIGYLDKSAVDVKIETPELVP